MRRFTLTISGCFFIFIMLVCTEISVAQEPKVYGELKYNETSTVNYFDPLTSESIAAERLTSLMFDTLVDIGQNLEPVPRLAHSFAVADDGNSIRVKMRPKATWHDGTPITADDVLFTYNLINSTQEGINRSIKTKINRIKEIKKHDSFDFTAYLYPGYGNPAFVLVFPILPRHMGDKMSDNQHGYQRGCDFSIDPKGGGSGPFQFSRRTASGITILDRNGNYYNVPPFIKNIKMSTVVLLVSIRESIRTGSIHLAIDLPPDMVGDFENDGMHKVVDYNSLSFEYIGYRYENNILRNKNIRKAIVYGTNRKEMLGNIFSNRGTVLSGPYTPADPGHNRTVQPYEYDPEFAKELLINAGFSHVDDDGIRNNGTQRLSFRLIYVHGSRTRDTVAESFKGFMKNIGIDIQLNKVARQRFRDSILNSNFDMILGKREYNAFAEIAKIFWGRERLSNENPNGYNVTRYHNAAVDSLLDEIVVSSSASERRNIKWKLHEILHEEQPYMFLWTINKTLVFKRSVRNINIDPFDIFNYVNKWWIDENQDM